MGDITDSRLADALRTLRAGTEVPAADAAYERALLQAFDARVATRFRRPPVWSMVAAAALAGVVAGLHLAADPGAAVREARIGEPGELEWAEFVEWPGADAYPRLETAALVRVQLPTDVVAALGLAAPDAAAGEWPADLLIGQDGLTRAVRLAR